MVQVFVRTEKRNLVGPSKITKQFFPEDFILVRSFLINNSKIYLKKFNIQNSVVLITVILDMTQDLKILESSYLNMTFKVKMMS